MDAGHSPRGSAGRGDKACWHSARGLRGARRKAGPRRGATRRSGGMGRPARWAPGLRSTWGGGSFQGENDLQPYSHRNMFFGCSLLLCLRPSGCCFTSREPWPPSETVAQVLWSHPGNAIDLSLNHVEESRQFPWQRRWTVALTPLPSAKPLRVKPSLGGGSPVSRCLLLSTLLHFIFIYFYLLKQHFLPLSVTVTCMTRSSLSDLFLGSQSSSSKTLCP